MTRSRAGDAERASVLTATSKKSLFIRSAGTCTVQATSVTQGSHAVRASIGTIELKASGSPLDVRFLGKPMITSPKDDFLLNDNPLVIEGLGTAEGNTIIVSDQYDKSVCTATVKAGGTWSCMPTKQPQPGTEITVVAKDEAGNESEPTTVTGKTSGAQPASFTLTVPPAQVAVKTGGTTGGSMATYGLLMNLTMGINGIWVAAKRRKTWEK